MQPLQIECNEARRIPVHISIYTNIFCIVLQNMDICQEKPSTKFGKKSRQIPLQHSYRLSLNPGKRIVSTNLHITSMQRRALRGIRHVLIAESRSAHSRELNGVFAYNPITTPCTPRHQARPHRRESNGSLVEIEWRRELSL